MNIKSLMHLPMFRWWKSYQQKKHFRGSAEYWEDRYSRSGNSGSGSYEHLAEFKAGVLNEFVRKHDIKKVLEFGCGDGNQLKLADYPEYIGLDVSPSAISMCMDLFGNDRSKSFYLYSTLSFQDHANLFRAELTLSLDVLFHLVEQNIFETYLRQLFHAADRFVIIYASDFDQAEKAVYLHDKRRNFTGFVEKNILGWRLKEVIKNKYPVEEFKERGSLSDFYIYEKDVK